VGSRQVEVGSRQGEIYKKDSLVEICKKGSLEHMLVASWEDHHT